MPLRLRLPPLAYLMPLALPLFVGGCPTSDDDDDGDGSASAADTGSTTAPATTDAGSDTAAVDSTGEPGTTASVDDTSGGSSSDDAGSESGTTGEVACGPPVELGVFVPADGDARGFAVDGDTVFLAVTSAGLEAVDITDPANPASLGAVDFGNGELAFTVAIAGDHAYVGQRGSGWKIVDISDPAAMVEVASEDTDDAEDVAVVGDIFFVVNGNGLRTYDVTDPTMPSELSPTVVLPGASNSLAVEGDTAYVAASGGGLVAVDVTVPAMPMELSVFETSANATHVAIDGTTVFVSHADGVNILDMTDPGTPAELGVYMRDRGQAIATDAGTLYVLGDDTASTQVPFLAIVDVSDPATPLELDVSFDTFEDPGALVVDGGRVLFSAEDDDALHILDPCPAT
ncbi:MAG: hypothetical protein AAF721_05340 [Myxococcota bacterium]